MSYLYAVEMQIPGYSFAPIKIGFSIRPSERTRALAIGPFPVTCLGFWEAPRGLADEAEVHQRFRRLRLYGEWFYPAPELRTFLDEKLPTLKGLDPKSRRVTQFEHRLKNLGLTTAARSQLRLSTQHKQAIDVYMASLRDRWPDKGLGKDLQPLRDDELAPLLGVSTEFVKEHVPSMDLDGYGSWRYLLRHVETLVRARPELLLSEACA